MKKEKGEGGAVDYTTIEAFDDPMKERIIKVWQTTFPQRWKYGMVKMSGYDVVICLKGGAVRNKISGDEIPEHIKR